MLIFLDFYLNYASVAVMLIKVLVYDDMYFCLYVKHI